MTIRRFNYTGRKRIDHRDALISLASSPNGDMSFEARLSLGDYSFPDRARVFVEAYRQMERMRFDYGRAGALSVPSDRRLKDFQDAAAVRFRVIVTTESSPRGKILGAADQIVPTDSGSAPHDCQPLLPVKPAESMDELWHIDFSDEGPILEVNDRLDDWRALPLRPEFMALAYPAILREILTRALIADAHDDDEDDERWPSLWIRFAKMLPGMSPPPEDANNQDTVDWIDEAVRRFAQRIRLLQHASGYLRAEEQ